jgi:sugar lactone lactonase YvrE
MAMGEAVCVWDVRAQLGEGPVWIAEEAALWFVDIKGHKIHRFHPESGDKQTWDSPEPCGFLAPVEGGGFIAGLQSGLHLFDPTNGGFSLIAEIEPDIPDNRLNDGFVAADGRLWFGTMDNNEETPSGKLYSFFDGVVTAHDDGYVITNGPAESPDGKTLYHVDTLKREIYAFDKAGGALSNKRVFARVQKPGCGADGPAVDAAGVVWQTLFGGWGVERFAPDGGYIGFVDVPVPNITKLAFGGPDLKTAYVTTAWLALSEEARAASPQSGSLFAIELDSPGLPQAKVRLGR